jgi:hypothetical protein
VGERPNWGWGEFPPTLVFTEAEIREAMAKHHQTGPDQGERSGLCSCRYTSTAPAQEYSIDHLIDYLKEAHYGRQESKYSHPALGGKGASSSAQ